MKAVNIKQEYQIYTTQALDFENLVNPEIKVQSQSEIKTQLYSNTWSGESMR